MPVDNLDEEGLPRNPDVRLAQLRFLLTAEELATDKSAVQAELMTAIVENGNSMCWSRDRVCIFCMFLVIVVVPCVWSR